MNRRARAGSERNGVPSVWAARAISCSTVGSAERNARAKAFRKARFGMLNEGSSQAEACATWAVPAFRSMSLFLVYVLASGAGPRPAAASQAAFKLGAGLRTPRRPWAYPTKSSLGVTK
jgi:hypothetical protein